MRIMHLSLTNFRNFSRLELDLPAGTILVQGDNAQGKTNLLEAIYCLSRMRSPRTNVDRELVNWLALEDDLPFARLVAQIQKAEEGQQIELSLVQGSAQNLSPGEAALRKHIRVNGANKRSLDAIGLLSTVLFLPEDIDLVSGAPHLRRRYLDDTICQIDTKYRRELQEYERVLTQRNCLLKSLRGQSNDSGRLLFWDQRLVEHGAYIVVRRQHVIQQLDRAVQRAHPQLTGDKEHLRLEYYASVRVGGGPGAIYQMVLSSGSVEDVGSAAADMSSQVQRVASSFAEQLREVHSRELEQGMSVVGPHRDDVRFLVGGVDMNVYGSRGQQRSIALSLKLAEVEVVAHEKKDKPVLLLDDVISELDVSRRNCLMDAIMGEASEGHLAVASESSAPGGSARPEWGTKPQQVIITTTDLTPYSREFLERATLWQVCAGRLEKLTPASEAAS